MLKFNVSDCVKQLFANNLLHRDRKQKYINKL